jgi:hypothetical protein
METVSVLLKLRIAKTDVSTLLSLLPIVNMPHLSCHIAWGRFACGADQLTNKCLSV